MSFLRFLGGGDIYPHSPGPHCTLLYTMAYEDKRALFMRQKKPALSQHRLYVAFFWPCLSGNIVYIYLARGKYILKSQILWDATIDLEQKAKRQFRHLDFGFTANKILLLSTSIANRGSRDLFFKEFFYFFFQFQSQSSFETLNVKYCCSHSQYLWTIVYLK